MPVAVAVEQLLVVLKEQAAPEVVGVLEFLEPAIQVEVVVVLVLLRAEQVLQVARALLF
jgi:hypothetical protein